MRKSFCDDKSAESETVVLTDDLYVVYLFVDLIVVE